MKKSTYDQVLNASLDYFNGDELAAKVFTDKYALQNKDGEYLELTPTDMHHRLAKELARIESKYPNPMTEDEIFKLLDRFKYIVLQGSPMSAIGNTFQLQSAGNCYVVDSPLDSYGGICKTDQELAQLMKRRSGIGTDISKIRPKGVATKNAARTTDGIGVFMERFSNTCREVAQNGRRGALLLSISIEHPEIETFITIKRDLKKVTGANISIRLTDEFIEAAKNDKDFILRWPVESKNPVITKTIKARELWDKIIDSSWLSAEPGLFFWDNVIKNSIPDVYADEYPDFRTQSSNPCGEILMGIDSCRLTIVNLQSFVNNQFTEKASFDFKLFGRITQKAKRIMDDIIDLEIELIGRIIDKINSDPEPEEIKSVELNMWKRFLRNCIQGRRTGLGITALGDAIAMLNVKYGSKKSIDITHKIYRALAVAAHTSSCIMANERGAFPIFNYKKEKDHDYLNDIMKDCGEDVINMWKNTGRRNVALTTTAPAGSISTLTQTTSGIEPPYLLQYKRRKKINPSDKLARVDFVDQMGDKWQEFIVNHHGLQQWMDITGETDIKKSPYWGATSNDVDWVASVDIQAAAQKSIDHSISKTCNLPNSATKELVSDVYMRAWETCCKGFTVYRDGSRAGVLLKADEENEIDLISRPVSIHTAFAPKRPDLLTCDIKKVKIQGEQWTMFVGLLDNKPYEIFGGLSKYVDIQNKHKSGKIQKNGKVEGISTYNLII